MWKDEGMVDGHEQPIPMAPVVSTWRKTDMEE